MILTQTGNQEWVRERAKLMDCSRKRMGEPIDARQAKTINISHTYSPFPSGARAHVALHTHVK